MLQWSVASPLEMHDDALYRPAWVQRLNLGAPVL